MILSFECYTGVIDPVQHLWSYQVKIAVHSHDDHIMCWVFPSSLKDMALDWFYSLLSQSLRSFEKVSNAFFNQYALRQKFKKNSNHLLIIKMKPGETLKRYISYFQNQMVMVYNCIDDVTSVAFIVGLQTDHSYKHLVKHDITNMKDIL